MRVFRSFFAFAMMLPLCGGAAEQSPELKRAQQKARREAEWRVDGDVRLEAGTFPMDSVCTLRTENGRLKLSSRASRFFGNSVQRKIEGLPEPVVVYAQWAGRLTEFRLSTRSFSDERAVAVETEIEYAEETLSIHRAVRRLDGHLDVTFIQNHGTFEETGMEPGVVLTVLNRSEREREFLPLTFKAPDFATLRQRHPDAVDRYLRPILRDLRLSSALGIEPRLGWRAFAEEWRPDPAVRGKVEELLPRLDSAKPAERDAALDALRALGPEAALAVLHLDRRGLSAEQNSRLDVLLEPLSMPSDDRRVRLRDDVQFLCDCLYSKDERILASAAEHLGKKLGRPVEMSASTPPHRRIGAVERIRDELSGGEEK